MSDQPNIDIPAVIAAAIAAAGERGGGRSDAAWKASINRAIPHIVAMLGEGSHQTKIATEVAEAQVFTSVYLGYEIEESSTRAVVSLETRVTDDHPDGVEKMRTHRTDNDQGEAMKIRLNALKQGDPILVWKAMEKMGNDRKVRVFVHFEKLWKKQDQNDRPREQVSGNQREEPSEQRAAAPAAHPLTDQIDTDRLKDWRARTAEALGNEGYGKLVSMLELTGYDINGVSEVEWGSVVKPLIRQLMESQQ